ncbi:hypothetical protein HN51_062252 [Arachis hypogaea]|uniref:uncharacterized protein LOC107629052 n=1 Tax=Arachis ipaensis TaxID=130454 RepID=UPI0007AFC37D|nr:uncharacterized protein LOC107629052 [Arachis ipaensis]XP_016187235.1 uncharacterized protein LOC107629052 [Arachis ipaensis]XP_020975893.1 uncharacterized protein LOC107629052 [Arachis ipaensis]XP_025627566.1 uncharacterized protein LOC112720733 [Arachis hypogaea]XP_025627567.1 uncharacterized protein LOC112720733 [Arachis hypogaea]QHO19698.1 uncharacterized protein DS421_11g331280 [Arachis hypogaea]
MASSQERGAYRANCFAQDFRKPNSSDQPSSFSKDLESDWPHSSSVDDHDLNSDRSTTGKRWWLNVKTNMGGRASYTSQPHYSWRSEQCAVYGFVDDDIKLGADQSDFDALSYAESANVAVDHPWYASPTCVKTSSNTKMSKTEASLHNDFHLTAKKKEQKEFCFSDGHFMDCDIADFLSYEQSKMSASDLESHLMGAEKTGPWWRTAGKDELASLVAQKSIDHIENCDLPQPQTKHIKQKPSVDLDKTPLSSIDWRAKTGSPNINSCTSGTPTSGYSYQDSNMNFCSSQSKDSSSSSEDRQTNSENSSVSDLLEALCHSQKRAREAEKAAQQAYSEKEHLLSLFFRQASQLFAYKQWFHILQLENLCLQLPNINQPLLNLIPASLPWMPMKEMQLKKKSHRRNGNKKCGIGKCVVAFAVGLGLSGAGLILGWTWTMGWMFPSL